MGLELFTSQSAGAFGTLVTGWVPSAAPPPVGVGTDLFHLSAERPWQHPGHRHTILKGPGHRAGQAPPQEGSAGELCTLFTGGQMSVPWPYDCLILPFFKGDLCSEKCISVWLPWVSVTACDTRAVATKV